MAAQKINDSTQLFLDISEIKNDTVIMKDGSLRAVLMVSSINFALKSEDEQNALISSYVTFLNYLNFPIQIVIQSRKLDIEVYIKRIEDAERNLTNELLRRQILDYKAYVKELVELGDIMTKRFFIAIPYSSLESTKTGFFDKLMAVFTPAKVVRLKQDKFNKFLHELNQRCEHVNMNISSIGLTSKRLDTQSLIELYYTSYNPAVAQNQKLQDLDKLQVEQN
jgi:type IV secretory pathway VirB4 component